MYAYEFMKEQHKRTKRVIFPNKEIDFYNWRQLRHTLEFIFQFMFLMRNAVCVCVSLCSAHSIGLNETWLAFLLFTSLINNSKCWIVVFFFFTCCCCCFVMFLQTKCLCCCCYALFFPFNRSIDWIDQTAIKMECILSIFLLVLCLIFADSIKNQSEEVCFFFSSLALILCFRYFIDVQVWAVTQVAARSYTQSFYTLNWQSAMPRIVISFVWYV